MNIEVVEIETRLDWWVCNITNILGHVSDTAIAQASAEPLLDRKLRHFLVCTILSPSVSWSQALFTNDVYKPYHHPMLQMMTFVDGTVQGVLQRMIVDENL